MKSATQVQVRLPSIILIPDTGFNHGALSFYLDLPRLWIKECVQHTNPEAYLEVLQNLQKVGMQYLPSLLHQQTAEAPQKNQCIWPRSIQKQGIRERTKRSYATPGTVYFGPDCKNTEQ